MLSKPGGKPLFFHDTDSGTVLFAQRSGVVGIAEQAGTVLFGFGCKFEHIQFSTPGFTAQGQECANFIPVFCQLFALGLFIWFWRWKELFQHIQTVFGGVSP